MDEKKIFIVNLSKGRMGETNAALLGSMLVVKIYLAAMSRADEPSVRMAQLPRFYFYVDEFQSMMNEAFADILSESRKYKLALTLANQYIEQMEEKVRDAVFGNVGTLVCFRVGPFDAEVLKIIFEPTFTPEDLVGLGIGQIYLTLMIDGVGSRPFSAETIPPIDRPAISYRDDVVRHSRELYARPRADMEAHVAKRQKDFAPPPKHDTRGNRGGQGGSNFQQSGNSSHRGDRDRRDRDMSRGPRIAFVARSEQRSTPPHVQASRDTTPRKGATERDALRAAISSALPSQGHIQSRSPVDILRERLARKATPHDATHTPTPAHTPAKHEPHTPPASATAEKRPGNGEISTEELQRVLHGDETQ